MLIEEVKQNLTDKIIPFWHGLKDKTYGGYYSLLDFELNLDQQAEKGCILNSRILWFFSNAYKLLGDKNLLEDAKHAYDFMMRYCMDNENGGVYWSVGYDGKVCDSTKHTYNQAFAIYALASYYEVSGDETSIQAANTLYGLIEDRCKDEVGYLEAFDAKFQPIKNDKLSENEVIADKTMNTLLHVFEAYSELYRVTRQEKVAVSMKWILDLFADKVYNKEEKRQEVFFDKNMNSILDLHSYGHDIETSWLLDRGCEILADKSYTEKIQPITKALAKKIYETAYQRHSLVNECCNGVVNQSRIWWVQAEAMVGFLNGYQNEPEKIEYLQAVKDIWNYIKKHFIDERKGSEWFWEVDENGLPSSKKPIVEPWKCPYHNGRMCIEIIRRNIDVE